MSPRAIFQSINKKSLVTGAAVIGAVGLRTILGGIEARAQAIGGASRQRRDR
ncbi:hypothetical protein V474_14310 [Novosphingobium barchaimii LL02]|uniref:Uncharacterized protein n=1 Tax=Novosphingobium barchaimii LL02 TaxID=1114963 RepID=A0A0J7XY83_9SPHN|nr:hypothetical protein [Novosphingobium barchaimii]KMS56631.1 hypothetical protein V474_14310 [Novosphingobium barchaimii LL02]